MNVPIARTANRRLSIGEIVGQLKVRFVFGPLAIGTLFLRRTADARCTAKRAAELPLQRPGRRVRLQIRTRKFRSEMHVRNFRRRSTASQRPPLRDGSAALTPYYGPTREARSLINRILKLSETGEERAWEIEIAKPSNMEKIVDTFGHASLDTEARSAIALLLLHAIDRGALDERIAAELPTRIRWHLGRDPLVLGRMRFWWTHREPSVRVVEALR